MRGTKTGALTPGDSLSKIAKRYKTSTDEIAKNNNIKDVAMKFYFSKRNFMENKNYIKIVFNIEALLNGDCNGFISSCIIDVSNEEIINFKNLNIYNLSKKL